MWQSAALPPVILCKTGKDIDFFLLLDFEGHNEREAYAVNKGKGRQSQDEEVVMFLASVSLAEQNVFFSWLAGTLGCPCFYHYFSKKLKTH